MNHFTKLVLALICSVSMHAMANDNADDSSTSKGVKEWTFLTYINGYNSLDSFGEANIKSMEQVGSTDSINLVVEWGSMADTKTTKRLYVTKSTDPTKVTSQVVDSFPVVDMGNYQSLQDFIAWGVKAYPAKHYFVNVWNHGNGWHLENIKTGIHTQDISFDDNSGHSISTEQLAAVLKSSAALIGHPVDIYGSDACMMASAEVAAQMAGSVAYFVGSEETEPGEGWPYAPFLTRWVAAGNPSAADIAKMLTQEYTKAYSGGIYGTQDVTFSAYDMSKIDGLLAAVKSLGEKLAAADMKKVVAAANSTQSYALSDYKDLQDFVEKISLLAPSAQLETESVAIQAALQDFVIENQTNGRYKNSHGVSIWVPDSYSWQSYGSRYSALDFNLQTAWSNFLTPFVAASGSNTNNNGVNSARY